MITTSTTAAKVTTPAKQSTKTTSVLKSIGAAVTAAVKATVTGSKAVAKSVATAAEAAKKKAAAEAAAKKKPATTNTTQKKTTTTAAEHATAPASKNLIDWGNSHFYVTPSSVRSYKGLQINTSCDTKDEENGGEKYIIKKNNGGYEVKLTAILDKRLGETDVRKEAMRLAESARVGEKGYVYCHGSKLFTPQMMGTGAGVKNIVTTPDGTWISCEVELTLKQCSKGDGSTAPATTNSSNGGGSGYKYSVTVYYSGSSGAIQSVTGYSNTSKEDARKKAWAKVPKTAQWASETKSQATNQTTNAKNNANKTTNDAKKDAEKYLNDKFNSTKNNNSSKLKPANTKVKVMKQ